MLGIGGLVVGKCWEYGGEIGGLVDWVVISGGIMMIGGL